MSIIAMHRTRHWLAGLLLLGALRGSARADEPAIPDFDKIRTPDSPAFMLLGLSPTQIERPTTPKELTVVLSQFASEGLTVPKDLAVELAPYAIFAPAPGASAYRDHATLRNLTVSFATSQTTIDGVDAAGAPSATPEDHLAIGVRTMWRFAKPRYDCAKLTSRTTGALGGRSSDWGALTAYPDLGPTSRAALIEQIQAITDTTPATTSAEPGALVAPNMAGPEPDASLFALCAKEVGSVNRGWLAEAAAATSFKFSDSTYKSGRYERASAWLDLAYQGEGKSLVMLARIRDDKTSGDHDVFSDVGLRGIVAKDAYAASVEVLWRHAVQRTDGSTAAINTYRAALAFDMHLTDGTWLTVSFGRDFAAGDASSLFSIANLKWGIGDPKIVAPKAKDTAGTATPAAPASPAGPTEPAPAEPAPAEPAAPPNP